MRRQILLICTTIATAIGAVGSARADDSEKRITIVSGTQRSYRQAAEVLREVLWERGHACALVELPERTDAAARTRVIQELREAKPHIVAVAGAAATTLVLESIQDAHVVFFMVPNSLDASFMTDRSAGKARVTGVPADASPEAQIDWIRKLNPQARRIGVLHSVRTRQTVAALNRAAQARGITLFAIEASRTQFPKAIDALNSHGVHGTLMIPDGRVYNSVTVQRLLLWGIRQKKPVWGFSPSIVKAGAFAGQHCDPEVVGRRTAELVEQVIGGTPPPELGVQYVRKVGHSVNQRTAEMIGLTVPSGVVGPGTTVYGVEP
ncbi:MAG: hypothetical protein GY842_14495 [bacterium]|nr:hypothetical protein [bacterium]